MAEIAEITDEYMREQMGRTRGYTVVVLYAAEKYGTEGSDKIVWEHGRNNFSMRADGLLSIVCPVLDDSKLRGIGIFNASLEETQKLMEADPGVQAGVFTFEVHPVRSFPGDALPA